MSHLIVACVPGNRRQGNQSLAEFGEHQSERVRQIQALVQAPFEAAAAVNSTLWAFYHQLQVTELPIAVASGGGTQCNRRRLGIPKEHGRDVAWVGAVDAIIDRGTKPVLSIKVTGGGNYQRTRLIRYGFPRGYLMPQKAVQGVETGDLVKAVVPTERKMGTYRGPVTVRTRGNFNIQSGRGWIEGISHRFCTFNQRVDGYGDVLTKRAPEKGEAGMGRAEDSRTIR